MQNPPYWLEWQAYEAAAAAVRDALINDIPCGLITRAEFSALVEIRELAWKAFSSRFYEA
jgi:hypothetical protein